jgi:type IV pilus assembly protein PilX
MFHPILRSTHPNAECGFALITGLLFLVVMSLIGVTMMNATRMETMMAGGARETNIAFQAAEAALRAGEQAVQDTDDPDEFNGSPGMLGESDNEPDFLETDSTATDYAWNNTSSLRYSADTCPSASSCYPEVAEQPRYVVKHVDNIFDESAEKKAISIGGYAQGAHKVQSSVFRVTARGTSRDGSAEALLQSYYGKIY